MQTFTAYSTLHGGMVALIAALMLVAIAIRRRREPSAHPASPFELAVATGYLALWVGTFGGYAIDPGRDPATDYPLQLCHWAAVIAALALLTGRRVWRALAYFWGLALCTQAIVTPNLTEGPAIWPFWFFWTTHAMIVAVPIYDVAARAFRPTWRDYGLACGAAALYVAIVLPIDLATGWNYGFVGPSRPDVPTIIDALGAWPRRLVWIAGVAAGAMALLMLPWSTAAAVTRIRARWRQTRQA
jgi:hypothetical integral membrane protein (TIGR02206 family)